MNQENNKYHVIMDKIINLNKKDNNYKTKNI